MHRCSVYQRKEGVPLNCRLNAVLHSFQGMSYYIEEDPTVTVQCRIAIKPLFLYFNLCISVKLYSLSC